MGAFIAVGVGVWVPRLANGREVAWGGGRGSASNRYDKKHEEAEHKQLVQHRGWPRTDTLHGDQRN